MRRIDNPRHRFESQYVEWLDERPPAQLDVYEESATKEIVSTNDSPDLPFRHSVNPYRGCTHACAYCYARPSHEYLGFGAGTDFETRIVAKLRAPELLRAKLASKAWSFESIMFSGDTDCYQPIEAHYRLTRGCLEACRDASNPVSIVTKSFLISRDVDVLAALARRTRVSVAFSLAFDDDDLARVVEPGTPRPAKRLEAMRILTDAGVRCGVLLAPIIPGLNEEAIPAILERAKEAGARFADRLMLRLPHSVKDVFLERMNAAMPDRARRIESRIREVRGGALNDARFGDRFRGQGVYWDVIDALFQLHARKLGFAVMEAEDAKLPAPARHGEQIGLF
jgi:DNA repair photolyase